MKLPGDYVAGFVDGEGCFALKYRRDRHLDREDGRVYFYWTPEFAIFLHKDDAAILYDIQETIGCGRVVQYGKYARFSVQRIEDQLNLVIPFFQQHPLRAKKQRDFAQWSDAVALAARYKKSNQGVRRQTLLWEEKDTRKMIEIRNSLLQLRTAPRAYKWSSPVTNKPDLNQINRQEQVNRPPFEPVKQVWGSGLRRSWVNRCFLMGY